MVVKIILLVSFFFLLDCLIDELLHARKWKRLVKYPQKYGFTSEEFEEIEKRDRDIKKKNKLFNVDWYNPTKDIRKARKVGFIRIPVHINAGLADELYCHTSPYYRAKIFGLEAFDEGWKDKYDTPRFETPPHIYITLFNTIGINIIWFFPYKKKGDEFDDDRYWEQVLWCLYYCDGDLDKARTSWPWRNQKEESTWSEKYVTKNKQIKK